MKRIILVRPSGPRNVGMILRTVCNFGPAELFLVAPERPSLLIHPEFEQMSHGVEGARERCTIVAELSDALADCTSSVAFTARVRGHRVRADWRERQEEISRKANEPGERLGLVFGNEIVGLEIRDTDQCQELCYIPTSEEHTSLNLAMAVGIVMSRIFVERGYRKHEPGGHMLDGAGREYLKANLRHVFGEKVARSESAASDIVASIDRLFSRMPLENRDARAWHLMLRALGSDKTPQDFDLRPAPSGARRREALDRKGGRGSAGESE